MTSSFPLPVRGLVLRYAYLWADEHDAGREEGVKDRPCAVILTVEVTKGRHQVLVLPISHRRPDAPEEGVEIPSATKRRLGLDDQPSWIILTEGNRFMWPGPDLRPARNGDPASAVYGHLPSGFYRVVRERWADLVRRRRARLVPRTE